MSSVDSSLLSGASYVTHNVYSGIFRQFKTSKSEKVLVFRVSVLLLGICSTLLALSTSTIYGLWVLAGDLGFVIVFPQFFASVFYPEKVSKLGSIVAAVLSILLRILIGEPLLSIPSVIPLEASKMAPLKTTLMLFSMFILYSVSRLAKKLC